jgi:hypothetical protein
MFAPHDYYDWNALVNSTAREQLVLDIDKTLIYLQSRLNIG